MNSVQILKTKYTKNKPDMIGRINLAAKMKIIETFL